MKVSLVATVKDAGPDLREFLDSLARQTRRPDEVIVVDGGSTDGTLQTLRDADGVLLLSEPGANIARGRNVAVRAATHDVVAVTDPDCVLAPDWVEQIIEPLGHGADVSAGFYRPIANSLLEVCSAAVSLPERDELRPGWMPSSRSIAFRRSAFEEAGGYPEWLAIGEDMYLNHALARIGAKVVLAPDAVVYWRMRPTIAATWRQYANYAEGDALSGMYLHRHLIRFATYAFALSVVAVRRRPLVTLATAGAGLYAARPVRRALARIPRGSSHRTRAIGAVPLMMAFIDAAKMAGYLRGTWRRVTTDPARGPAPAYEPPA